MKCQVSFRFSDHNWRTLVARHEICAALGGYKPAYKLHKPTMVTLHVLFTTYQKLVLVWPVLT